MNYGESVESKIGSQTGTHRFNVKDDTELAKDPIYDAVYRDRASSASKSDNQKKNDHYYPLKSNQEQRQDSQQS